MQATNKQDGAANKSADAKREADAARAAALADMAKADTAANGAAAPTPTTPAVDPHHKITADVYGAVERARADVGDDTALLRTLIDSVPYAAFMDAFIRLDEHTAEDYTLNVGQLRTRVRRGADGRWRSDGFSNVKFIDARGVVVATPVLGKSNPNGQDTLDKALDVTCLAFRNIIADYALQRRKIHETQTAARRGATTSATAHQAAELAALREQMAEQAKQNAAILALLQQQAAK
jgi:hypothetical protein